MITRKMAVEEIEHFLRARRNYYAHEIADSVVSRIDEAYAQIELLTKERDVLRAKIEQMEQQGPAQPALIGWLDEADLRALQQGNAVWLNPDDQGRMIPVSLAAAPEAKP